MGSSVEWRAVSGELYYASSSPDTSCHVTSATWLVHHLRTWTRRLQVPFANYHLDTKSFQLDG